MSVGHLLVGRVEGRYTAPQTAESEPDVLGMSAGAEAGPQHLRLAVLGQNLAVASIRMCWYAVALQLEEQRVRVLLRATTSSFFKLLYIV